MKLLCAFLGLSLIGCTTGTNVLIAARSVALMKWEKGWKTSRVVAEYWPGAGIGYSLKFTFPENTNDSDRTEVSDTFEDFDCNIYEGGGYPGAPAYVQCNSVHDNASADIKLKDLLPALDDVLTRISLSSGPLPKSRKAIAREAAAPMTMAEWIAAENAKRKPCKEEGWNGSGSNGYDSWSARCEHGIEVYTDTTKETQEAEAKEAQHQSALAQALVSRCLTAKEFQEVTSYGHNLYVRPMIPFMQEDVQSRFNAALQTQQILQQHCPVDSADASKP